MTRRFEETVIRHCAPTLAGHKCGSLFACQPPPGESLAENLRQLNAALGAKGVRARVLRRCRGGGLVYVYRERALAGRLSQPDIRAFLNARGYSGLTMDDCLGRLSGRMRTCGQFPHEIGVFLGYPLADVMGFIEHGGRNFLCLGCWKAYSNEAEARRLFALYQKCRAVYLACYQRGVGVARLTVAA